MAYKILGDIYKQLSVRSAEEPIAQKAFECYLKALEQEDHDTDETAVDNKRAKQMAHIEIAKCYSEGLGVEKNDELADYHFELGKYKEIAVENLLEKLSNPFINSSLEDDLADLWIADKNFNEQKNEIEEAFKNSNETHDQTIKDICLTAIDQAAEIDKINQELVEKNKQLQASQIELEDMMSMFAHKFRSPLDAIIYNTTHENQVKLYTEAAQTMRGLLNIFSIISTDADILKDKIKQDYQGGGSLAAVFSKTLDMILLHLLSVSGAEKIQQHYMAYAQRHGQCDENVIYKVWCEDYFELEQALQAEWEASYAQLLNQSNSLEQRLTWLEEHFFKLVIIGFERTDIQFKEYGTTESLLTILLNEILVNAFKYYSSTSQQPVVLEWAEREDYQVLICSNPSLRSERTIIKGSHKGHVFLSTLARKTGSLFSKPIPQDHFVLEFGIPNELLISN
jgi:signal transduction histidine kinase